jgi:hypothetical protein
MIVIRPMPNVPSDAQACCLSGAYMSNEVVLDENQYRPSKVASTNKEPWEQALFRVLKKLRRYIDHQATGRM